MKMLGRHSRRARASVRPRTEEVFDKSMRVDLVVRMDVKMPVVESGWLLATSKACQRAAVCRASAERAKSMVVPPSSSVVVVQCSGDEVVVGSVFATSDVRYSVIEREQGARKECGVVIVEGLGSERRSAHRSAAHAE